MRRIIDYLPMATCNNWKWIIDISIGLHKRPCANVECNGKAKDYYDFRVKQGTKTNNGKIVDLFNFFFLENFADKWISNK